MKGSGLNIDQAMETAEAAAEKAYAPYSNFRVGAAVVTEGGEVYTGCNVENASYGLAICAERNAAAAMVLGTGREDRRISYVAVASLETSPAFPCGACRQVLHEFGCKEVVVRQPEGIESYPFAQILPNAFGPEDL